MYNKILNYNIYKYINIIVIFLFTKSNYNQMVVNRNTTFTMNIFCLFCTYDFPIFNCVQNDSRLFIIH